MSEEQNNNQGQTNLGTDKKYLEEQVRNAIRTVYDPEIPVNIYELGLIYGIDIDDENNVDITMTLTSPACPVAGTLPGEVEERIKQVKEVENCKVEITFEPPWEMSMMSEEARMELGLD